MHGGNVARLPGVLAQRVAQEAQTAVTPEALQGQVEHIVTGQEADFTLVADLLAFIAKVLTAGSKTA